MGWFSLRWKKIFIYFNSICEYSFEYKEGVSLIKKPKKKRNSFTFECHSYQKNFQTIKTI